MVHCKVSRKRVLNRYHTYLLESLTIAGRKEIRKIPWMLSVMDLGKRSFGVI